MNTNRSSFLVLSLAVLALVLFDASLAAAQSPDPTVPGPHAVTREEYDFGGLSFTPTGWPHAIELRGSVHYPSDLTGPPYPFIVLLHGRHPVCRNGTMFGAFQWPCPAG